MNTVKISLSTNEIYFLSEMLKIECLVGIKDPFRGITDKEIEENWIRVKDDLIKREIIFEKDTYEIDRKYAILVNALRTQHVYCWISLRKEHQIENHHYYFNEKFVVKRTVISDGELQQIELVGTPIEAFREIITLLDFHNIGSNADKIINMTRSNFNKLIEQMFQYNTIESNPSEIGKFKEVVELGIIVWNDEKSKWISEEVNFIQCENGLWLATLENSLEDELIVLKPITVDMASEQLRGIILNNIHRSNPSLK